MSVNKFIYQKINIGEIKNLDEDLRTKIDLDSHKQLWHWRRYLHRFIEIISDHPRVMLAFISSRMKYNAKEFLPKFKQVLEIHWDDDKVEERYKWFERSFMTQENSSKNYKLEDSSK